MTKDLLAYLIQKENDESDEDINIFDVKAQQIEDNNLPIKLLNDFETNKKTLLD